MAAQATRRRARPARGAPRARAKLSPEAQAAYGEIRQGVAHLEKSIAEIQRGLRKAERKIEADARARARELRKEARVQLDALKAKQREVVRSLKSLPAAAGDSWREIKASADSILADARVTTAAVVDRFRGAFRA